MRILHVTTHVNIGGIANYILSLSGRLKTLRHVDVMVASSGGNLEKEFEARKIPHIHLDIMTKFEFGPKVIKSAFRLAKIVRQEKIDIIHAHTRVSQVAVALASKLTGVRYVTTCHGHFKLRSRKMFDTWGRKVVAISDAVRSHLKYDLGVDKDRIKLIYSGVDVGRFSQYYSEADKSKLKDELGLDTAQVVGTVGRLSQVKGQRYLVQAMADIVDRRKNVKCLIVGDGEEKMALENLTRALNLRDSIVFIPSSIDTPAILSIMDVFVFPSVKEGLGIALLEAMAAGKACVASDIGGISDIIKDSSHGILVPVGDVKAIADAVVMLLDSKIPRHEMGENAKKLVSEKFSLDVMCENILQLYKEVINAKS